MSLFVKILLGVGIFMMIAAVVFFFWLSAQFDAMSPEEFSKKHAKLNEKIQNDPDNAKHYWNRAELVYTFATKRIMAVTLDSEKVEIIRRLNLMEQAESDLETAVKLSPDNDKYIFKLATVKKDKVIEQVTSLHLLKEINSVTWPYEGNEIKRYGRQKDTRSIISMLRAEQALYEDAEKWLDQMVAITPSDPELLVDSSKIKFALGKYGDAFAQVDNAIDIVGKKKHNPDSGKNGTRWPRVVDFLYVRAGYYLIMNQDQKALNDMSKAVKIWPYYGDVYVYRARLKNYLGDSAGAIEDMKGAIKQRPNLKDAYEDTIEVMSTRLK